MILNNGGSCKARFGLILVFVSEFGIVYTPKLKRYFTIFSKKRELYMEK
jgi:hypothetical protein